MKKVLIALCVLTVLSCVKPQLRKYKVQVTYCDNRPKKIVYITSYSYPSNSEINTWKEAVPKWFGELNVCEVKVLNSSIAN